MGLHDYRLFDTDTAVRRQEHEPNKARSTDGHTGFAKMLSHTPWLEAYWNFHANECDVAQLQRDMGSWSHGERIMAQFMAAVWLGENRLQFDLIEAAATLDAENRAIIAAWIANPYWP